MRTIVILLAAGAALTAQEPAEKVKLPTGRSDLAAGQLLFQNHCSLCHGSDGSGGRGPVLAQQKLKRGGDDAALVNVIKEGIRGTEMPGAWQMDDREIRQVAAYVKSLGRIQAKAVPGNPVHGREVYSGKAACSGCHVIKGEGSVMGPELTGIGLRRSAEYLRDSLVNPEAAVPDSFLQVRVVPNDGPAVTGVRLSEDSFTIQVRDYAGRLHSWWKRDLKDVHKDRGKSPMPSYKEKLTDSELTDLIAYLASLREDR
jgi:putative heme-binding domain-containing protein